MDGALRLQWFGPTHFAEDAVSAVSAVIVSASPARAHAGALIALKVNKNDGRDAWGSAPTPRFATAKCSRLEPQQVFTV